MFQSQGSGNLQRDWKQIARSLRIQEHKITEWDAQQSPINPIQETVTKMLLEFRSSSANGALLSELISVLRSLKYMEMANNLKLMVNPITTCVNQSNPESQCLITHSELHMMPDDEQNQANGLTAHTKVIQILLIVFASLVVSIAALLMFQSLKNSNENSSSNSSYINQNILSSPIQVSVLVGNYQEYVKNMAKLPTGSNVTLEINSANALDWLNCGFINGHMVEKIVLEGHFNTDEIILLLQASPNIKSLTLQNIICGADAYTKRQSFELNALKSVKFHDLNECPRILQAYAESVFSTNLRQIQFAKTPFTSVNIVFANKIIQNAHLFIRRLEFIETTYVPAVSVNVGTLGQVEFLRIDNGYFESASSALFNNSICRVLPNLEHFHSEIGYFSLSEFSSLSCCRNLRAVKMGIEVPEHITNLDLTPYRKAFKLLQKIELYVRFQAEDEVCTISGINAFKDINYELWPEGNAQVSQ